MDGMILDLALATLMVAVAFRLIVAFWRYHVVQARSRLYRMMVRVGARVHPSDDATIGAIRSEMYHRCRRCRAEAKCERWLAGREEGDNAFCPNVSLLQVLSARSRAST